MGILDLIWFRLLETAIRARDEERGDSMVNWVVLAVGLAVAAAAVDTPSEFSLQANALGGMSIGASRASSDSESSTTFAACSKSPGKAAARHESSCAGS
jgi:hypothetical protein